MPLMQPTPIMATFTGFMRVSLPQYIFAVFSNLSVVRPCATA